MVESRRPRRAQVDDALLEYLFAALNDPNPALRVAGLRLLVRLPVSRTAWFRLARWVDEQLEQAVQESPSSPTGVPFDELLEASLRIPVFMLREKLYPLLEPAQPQPVRLQVLWWLARARDAVAKDFLIPLLHDPQASIAQQAAFWLAHYDLYDLDQLNADGLADPIVRFWLSVTALRQDQYAPFLSLVTGLLQDELELPLLYGSPHFLTEQITACGRFPDTVLPFLRYLQSRAAGPLPQGIPPDQLTPLAAPLEAHPERLAPLLPLIEAWIAALELQAAPPPPPAAPPAPVPAWEGSPAALIASLYRADLLDLDTLQAILPRLAAAQKTALVSAWFAALARLTAADELTAERPLMPGIGNPVMQLPAWFWQGFDPDPQALFRLYVQLYPERSDLMAQLAWVISRAGMTRLAELFLPILPRLAEDQKLALLHLLEQASLMAGREFGPIFGDGPATSDALPVIRHFIDYMSAQAGPPDTGKTLETRAVPRFVQGLVYDNTDPASPQKLERAFLAGKQHLLNVWIGELKAGAIHAPGPINLEDLPDLPSWALQVYFWEPNHAPSVQMHELVVYRDQLPELPVSQCEFTFIPHPDLPDFQGRLAVVYQQNVLQMLFLTGKVAADLASISSNERIQLEWADIKGLGNPERLPAFELAFYNESDPKQGAGLMFFGGKAGLKHVRGLDKGIEGLITTLKEAGEPGELSLQAKEQALVRLASLGSLLYRSIREQIGADSEALLQLDKVTRLQLVSAVRDVLPLELVYVYHPPSPGARLCPNALQAIQMGACFTCNKLDKASAAQTICPMGFLGLRCTIERHVIRPLHKSQALREGEAYQLRVGLTAGEKTITLLKSSLCATSSQVEAHNRQTFIAGMQSLLANNLEVAKDWTDWKVKVKEKSPGLLILIPHTLEDSTIPALEIGSSELWESGIDETIVGSSPGTQPVVLLMGCETAVPEVPYQSFAAAFSEAGAAISVVTLSPIHESRATAMTNILVDQLHQSAQSGQTFSEALLQARRTAMAAGYAEALSLVADGDADWILNTEV